jgi:lysophospholipase L1-like esterase
MEVRRGAANRICLAALALMLAACGSAQPKLPKLAPADVVLAFGDSLTYGTGASEQESYPVVLSGLIGRKVVGMGVPGDVTAGGLERLPAALDETNPRLLLLCMGGNDMLRKQDLAQTDANLRAMIKLARDRGISVVLIAVPQPGIFSNNAPFYAAIARDTGVPLEDGILRHLLYKEEFKADPIHPNALGYRKMAEAIAELLRNTGAI